MLATRWEPLLTPFTGFNLLRNRMDNLFRNIGMEEAALPPAEAIYPLVNVWEDEHTVFVAAELPGVEPEKLELFVTKENQLTIKGVRTLPEPEKTVLHLREFIGGEFIRVIPLPLPVDADKVEGHYEKGILTVTLPKMAAVVPRRIAVKQ